jgi:hypothetical protein
VVAVMIEAVVDVDVPVAAAGRAEKRTTAGDLATTLAPVAVPVAEVAAGTSGPSENLLVLRSADFLTAPAGDEEETMMFTLSRGGRARTSRSSSWSSTESSDEFVSASSASWVAWADAAAASATADLSSRKMLVVLATLSVAVDDDAEEVDEEDKDGLRRRRVRTRVAALAAAAARAAEESGDKSVHNNGGIEKYFKIDQENNGVDERVFLHIALKQKFGRVRQRSKDVLTMEQENYRELRNNIMMEYSNRTLFVCGSGFQ